MSAVEFLIVGSPRSGTTLLQRLACDLDGVRIPFETHFFTKGVPIVERHGGFPVAPERLADVLAEYVALDVLAGSGLDAATVTSHLTTDRPDALALFDAVVTAATGGAAHLGEKTPGHLRWAARLAGLRPSLRVIGIVRDPRAVIASRQEVPWGGGRPDVLAERWCADQRDLVAVRDAIGDRFLLVRYEEMVADPDATRAAVGALIGAGPAANGDGSGAPAALEWETWKARSGEAVTDERVDRWQDDLDPAAVTRVAAVAAPVAAGFGYHLDAPGPLARLRIALDRRGRRRTAEVRVRRAEEDTAIAATVLGPAPRPGPDGPPA